MGLGDEGRAGSRANGSRANGSGPSSPSPADWVLLVSTAPHLTGELSDMPRDIPDTSGRDTMTLPGTIPPQGGGLGIAHACANPYTCGGKPEGSGGSLDHVASLG